MFALFWRGLSSTNKKQRTRPRSTVAQWQSYRSSNDVVVESLTWNPIVWPLWIMSQTLFGHEEYLTSRLLTRSRSNSCQTDETKIPINLRISQLCLLSKFPFTLNQTRIDECRVFYDLVTESFHLMEICWWPSAPRRFHLICFCLYKNLFVCELLMTKMC